MEIQENIAGLGKNHDKAAHEHDIAKRQSEAKPATENIDMMPHSVNKDGNKDFKQTAETDIDNVSHDAAAYAQKEHEKAINWENTNENGPDMPTF